MPPSNRQNGERQMFKLGKTKIPHRKHTAAMSAQRIPTPESVTIPMAQHIGAPAVPCVKVGDKVFVGTKIAEAGGYVSAPIHSSVSGVVKKIDKFLSSKHFQTDSTQCFQMKQMFLLVKNNF